MKELLGEGGLDKKNVADATFREVVTTFGTIGVKAIARDAKAFELEYTAVDRVAMLEVLPTIQSRQTVSLL
jgi:hypothetical protein